MVPVTRVAAGETIVQAGDSAVKPARREIRHRETAAVKPAAVKPATAMKSPTAVETASASVRCVREIWLEEDGRAQ